MYRIVSFLMSISLPAPVLPDCGSWSAQIMVSWPSPAEHGRKPSGPRTGNPVTDTMDGIISYSDQHARTPGPGVPASEDDRAIKASNSLGTTGWTDCGPTQSSYQRKFRELVLDREAQIPLSGQPAIQVAADPGPTGESGTKERDSC